jgi:hypothetical protein
MGTPFLDELLRRLRLSDPAAALVGRGRVAWRDPSTGCDVTLVTDEQELATAIRTLGEEIREVLWPDATVEQAGFNILLVHLDEVMATRVVAAPLRITAGGLVWPDEHRPL